VKKLFALRSRNTGRPRPMKSGGNMGGIAGEVQFAAGWPLWIIREYESRFVPHQGGLSQR
jgi:hypothetical protein